jgi:hypothetical protein
VAITPAGTRLTAQHRAQQLAVRAGSLRNLVLLWRAVDVTNLSGTIDTFVAAASLLAASDSRDSAAVASRYYRLFRAAEGVPGTPPAAPLAPVARPDAAAALRGAALRGIIVARRSGASVDQAARTGFVRTAGELAKLVLTGGRMTLLGAMQRDARALGFQRVTSSDPCAFCRMLASRGPVYKSERSADFETHGACGCGVEMVFDGSPRLGEAEAYYAEFTRAQEWARDNPSRQGGSSNPALSNYRRWLAAGSPTPGG